MAQDMQRVVSLADQEAMPAAHVLRQALRQGQAPLTIMVHEQVVAPSEEAAQTPAVRQAALHAAFPAHLHAVRQVRPTAEVVVAVVPSEAEAVAVAVVAPSAVEAEAVAVVALSEATDNNL